MGNKTTNIHTNLVQRCQENDKAAQFEVYKIYYKQMYNTSLRILNDTAEAEDVMQESFLDAFRKINAFSGEGSFAGWLRRIVVNNSIDALKKRNKYVPIEDLPEEPDFFDSKTDNQLNWQVEEIKKAIGLLPDDYRIILSLFLLEGYDHEEITQILGISYGTSRTRYSRAKKRLKKVLQHERTMNTYHPN